MNLQDPMPMARCADCPKKGVKQAVVGWGNPPRWLCQGHYEERLKEARQVIDRAMTHLQQSDGQASAP